MSSQFKVIISLEYTSLLYFTEKVWFCQHFCFKYRANCRLHHRRQRRKCCAAKTQKETILPTPSVKNVKYTHSVQTKCPAGYMARGKVRAPIAANQVWPTGDQHINSLLTLNHYGMYWDNLSVRPKVRDPTYCVWDPDTQSELFKGIYRRLVPPKLGETLPFPTVGWQKHAEKHW